MAERAPRVVAELGRPETPAETAARKAETSRVHRESRTTRNLVVALLFSLVLVFVLVLAVPRSNTPITPDVDIATVAAQAQQTTTEALAVPELPDGWSPNAAELRRSQADDVTSWYTGWITPGEEYLGMYQGFAANPSWTAELLARTIATGTTTVSGVEWTVYDHRDSSADLGNARYGMVAKAGGSTFVLLGTASPEEFAVFADAIAPTVQQNEE